MKTSSEIFGILAPCRQDVGHNFTAKYKVIGRGGKEYLLKLKTRNWEGLLEKCLWDDVTIKGEWEPLGQVFVPTNISRGAPANVCVYGDQLEYDLELYKKQIRQEGHVETFEVDDAACA